MPLLHLFCMASIYQCKTSIRSKYFLAHGQLNRRSWNATNRSNLSHPIMSDTDTDKTILISFIFVMIVKMKQNLLFGEYRLIVYFFDNLWEKMPFLSMFVSYLIWNKRTINVNMCGLTRPLSIKYLFMENRLQNNKQINPLHKNDH